MFFSLPATGLPYLGQTRRGDLLVRIVVVTPTGLSSEQERLLLEFEALSEGKPLEKVKRAARKIGKAMGIN